MTSFPGPISGGPRDPFDHSYQRAEPVEPDQPARDERPKLPEENTSQEKLGIASYLLKTLRKAVDFFLEHRSEAHSAEQQIQQNLLLFKNCFTTLKGEDRSEDVDFLNRMAKTWNDLLENGLHLKKDETVLKFKVLIKKIQHFPENQPHSLGYYLSENTNQKWVPFPYMELIHKIHSEHRKNPAESALTEWTALIDELLSLLQVE